MHCINNKNRANHKHLCCQLLERPKLGKSVPTKQMHVQIIKHKMHNMESINSFKNTYAQQNPSKPPSLSQATLYTTRHYDMATPTNSRSTSRTTYVLLRTRSRFRSRTTGAQTHQHRYPHKGNQIPLRERKKHRTIIPEYGCYARNWSTHEPDRPPPWQ